MVIEIMENYEMKVDDRNYILRINLNKQDKEGRDLYKILGYYTTVEGALEYLARYRTIEAFGEVESVTLNKYLKTLARGLEELKSAIKGEME